MTCAFCPEPPGDWCPACRTTLCQRHGELHVSSFDQPCEQREGSP